MACLLTFAFLNINLGQPKLSKDIHMPSISVENYLKNIYELEASEKRVTTSIIADKLKIAPASVTDMVKKLSSKGFLSHVPYKGVEVTEKGKRSALKIIRKHRLWEMFLVEVLHFSWDKIHDEAEAFEHIMSERMEQKIDEVLGHPVVDPHGDPIPNKKGIIRHIEYNPLTRVEEGTVVRVVRVNDAHPELLEYISKIGLFLKTKMTVLQRIKFDNSFVVKIGSRKQFLSERMAESIFVQRV